MDKHDPPIRHRCRQLSPDRPGHRPKHRREHPPGALPASDPHLALPGHGAHPGAIGVRLHGPIIASRASGAAGRRGAAFASPAQLAVTMAGLILTGLMLAGIAGPARAQTPIAAQTPACDPAATGTETGASRTPECGTILVTGSANPVRLQETGSAITVLDGATIEAQGFAFLHDALRTVPGIAVNQGGAFGSLAQVRIRGAEGRHTLVLIDGIEASSIGEGEFDFASVLAGNIARVEIARGPQSGLYGSNAMGGVINVITRAGDGPLFDGAIEAGSFGTVMARAALTAGDRDNFVSASGIVRSSRGFSSAALGTEPDGDANTTAYLRGGIALAPFARLDASLRLVDRRTDADGFDFSGGPLQGQAIDSDDFSATREWTGGAALTLDLGARVQSVFSGSFTDYTLAGGTGDIGTFGSVGQRFRGNGQTTFRATSGRHVAHQVTAFLDYESERFRNTFPFDPSQIAALGRQILGFGLEYRLSVFANLFLNGALRHDRNDEFADATTFMVNGSWVIARTGTRVHASLGTGASNPTFSQQFGFVPGMFVGNPALRPERKEGFDLGIEQRIGTAILFDLTYFRSRLEDEILPLFPSIINDTGTSRREGVEFAFSLDLGRIDLSGSYTHTNARDPDGAREVRRPAHTAALDASARWGRQGRGQFNIGMIYNGAMLDNDFRNFFVNFAADRSRLPAYFVSRIAGSYRIGDSIELFGRVENLLDATYQEVISYAPPGLSAFGGIRLALR